MNSTTSRRSRYSVRAAAVATTAAVIFGAAACGSETASDSDKPGGVPAHGAPGAKVQQAPHFPTSADAQERRAYAEQQEQYRRHLLGAAADERRQPVKVRRSASGDERRQPVG